MRVTVFRATLNNLKVLSIIWILIVYRFILKEDAFKRTFAQAGYFFHAEVVSTQAAQEDSGAAVHR